MCPSPLLDENLGRWRAWSFLPLVFLAVGHNFTNSCKKGVVLEIFSFSSFHMIFPDHNDDSFVWLSKKWEMRNVKQWKQCPSTDCRYSTVLVFPCIVALLYYYHIAIAFLLFIAVKTNNPHHCNDPFVRRHHNQVRTKKTQLQLFNVPS